MIVGFPLSSVYASIDAIDAALILAVELSLPDLVDPERVVSLPFSMRLDTPQDRTHLNRRPLAAACRRNAASIERPRDAAM
jgi:hypothetical protein